MSHTNALNRYSEQRIASHGARPYAPLHADRLATAGLAHDLGNLLQVASSALNIISRNPGVGSTPALAPVIDSAKTSLQRAAGLVRQTMRSAREPGGETEHADVSECLSDIARLARTTWPANIRVEIGAVPALPAVRCSPLGLQSAIMNLALNAREAMPNGGVLFLDVGVVESAHAAERIEVRVSDCGVGMTRETLARAFDPFFTTKTGGLGGLGLPMVRRFAEEIGGQVEIESEAGVGTTVILGLPVPGGMAAHPARRAAASALAD